MNDDDELIAPPDLVYVTYIRAAPQRIWEALTQSELTRQFFFGRAVESDWRTGSPWRMLQPDGSPDVSGEVLESDPPRRLKLSWRVDWAGQLEPAIVTYEIEQVGDVAKLTLTQHTPGAAPRKYVKAGEQGWAIIMSSLKSLLETGKPIIVKMEPPQ